MRGPSAATGPGLGRARSSAPLAVTLGCAWLAALNSRAPLLAIGPLLPLVIVDLKLSFTAAGLVSGLPLLLMGVMGLPGGWLADRFGAREVMIGCLTGITLAGVLRAMAPSDVVLVGGTILLGIAIGTLQPALPRTARDTLPKRTSLATAIYFNGLIVGGAAGLALTPFFVPIVGGWRGALLVWAVLGAVGAAGWLAVPPGPHDRAEPGPLRAAHVWQALRLPGMAALTLAMGTQSAIFFTFSSWMPTYLVGRGWSLTAATLPVALLPLFSLLASAFSTPVETRLGRRAVIAGSGAAVVLGVTLLLLAPDQTVWLVAIAVGAGTTFAFSVCMAAPAVLAPAQRVGITAGVLLALGYIESAVGPVAIGGLRDTLGSYEAGWLLVLALGMVLTAAALGIPGRLADGRSPDQV